ncbi:hypothetical protein F5J12DRAFT_781056 [Pisolithus orientalis]|uniref:uncharacterized protein n=1 Tax=Pisolithus orientalis TaxID=936130 RepID=UPI002223FD6F|nr:uncharacterized protein F5J12DRAFT_781056 [Pisolithus orientalis]KAI6020032.1 hypothetical protein F5J12DRAFT_781056 [Pisolithus orientalis]
MYSRLLRPRVPTLTRQSSGNPYLSIRSGLQLGVILHPNKLSDRRSQENGQKCLASSAYGVRSWGRINTDGILKPEVVSYPNRSRDLPGLYTESGNQRLLPSVVGNCQLPWLMASCTNGANRTSTSAGMKPLFGFIPRKVTGDQVREALVNSYTSLSTRYLRQGKDYPYTRRWTSSSDAPKVWSPIIPFPVLTTRITLLVKFSTNQIAVIVGETGSGKTTHDLSNGLFLPIEYQLPPAKGRIIACTHLRRVAVTSVSKRVAEEMDDVLNGAWQRGRLLNTF